MEAKHELYYDAMDCLIGGNPKEAKRLLNQSLKLDTDFVDAYVGLSAAYQMEGNFKKEKECADRGFELTKKKFGKWPDKMQWGILENRAYMRSICDKATTSQIAGDTKTAEKLYRMLLKMNPNDNQGVRYLIAGMFEGISPIDIDDMFDEGNEKQSWSKLEALVDRQNKVHKFWVEPKEEFGF